MTPLDHLVIAPIVIPAMAAPLTLLAMRRRRRVGIVISLIGCSLVLAAALALFDLVQDGAIRAYPLGDWPAPFGIVLVLDRLSAIMLVLAATLTLIVMGHSIVTGADRNGWHFHPLFHFQLLGLNGAFLTGDLFNLFVFFEVLLIASYALMLHGQGAARLKAGIAYVVVNIVGSAIFLIALGLLYALTGTLNMADLAGRVAALGENDAGMIRVAGLMLMIVFGLKAAVAPLHLWLPRTYAATLPVVGALFAIMTKVGVYAMIRVVPLVFGNNAGAAAWVSSPLLPPAGVLTAIIGFGGVLAARGLREGAAFAVLGSTGTLLLAVSGWTQAAMGAALFYLVHTTLASAALFLVADVTLRRRGQYGDAVVPTARFDGQEFTGLLYVAAAVAAVGLPPLSGFVGKLLILETTYAAPMWQVIWTTVLVSTLMGVIGFSRAGSSIFWKAAGQSADPIAGTIRSQAEFVAPVALLLLLMFLTVAAGPASEQARAAAAQIFAPQGYIDIVLEGENP